MIEDFNELDKEIWKNAKGMDWLMLLLYSINMIQVPLCIAEDRLNMFFLISNIIYLVLLIIMLWIRIREKNKTFTKLYIFGIVVNVFLIWAGYMIETITIRS